MLVPCIQILFWPTDFNHVQWLMKRFVLPATSINLMPNVNETWLGWVELSLVSFDYNYLPLHEWLFLQFFFGFVARYDWTIREINNTKRLWIILIIIIFCLQSIGRKILTKKQDSLSLSLLSSMIIYPLLVFTYHLLTTFKSFGYHTRVRFHYQISNLLFLSKVSKILLDHL